MNESNAASESSSSTEVVPCFPVLGGIISIGNAKIDQAADEVDTGGNLVTFISLDTSATLVWRPTGEGPFPTGWFLSGDYRNGEKPKVRASDRKTYQMLHTGYQISKNVITKPILKKTKKKPVKAKTVQPKKTKGRGKKSRRR